MGLGRSLRTVCLVVTLFHWPPADAQTGSAGLLEQAVELQKAGDYQGAIACYREFLKRHPGIADVHSNLGAAYAAAGDMEKAIQQYRTALEVGNSTDAVAVRYNLALAFYKSARHDEALHELERVLEERPEHFGAALLLADLHLRRGEPESVIALLRPFEAEHGEDRGLIYLLGTALIRAGRMNEGELRIDRILRNGESAEAQLMLGTAHLMVRDVPAALEAFRNAVRLNPMLPSANAYLGKALRETGQVDEAQECFLRELEINPLDFDANLFVGVHKFRREQKYEEALEHFRRALGVRPGALEVRFQVALVYLLQKRTDEALKMVEEVVREAPEFVEGHVTLTQLYYRLGRREEAERHRRIVEELRARKDRETVKQMPQ